MGILGAFRQGFPVLGKLGGAIFSLDTPWTAPLCGGIFPASRGLLGHSRLNFAPENLFPPARSSQQLRQSYFQSQGKSFGALVPGSNCRHAWTMHSKFTLYTLSLSPQRSDMYPQHIHLRCLAFESYMR